MSRPTTILGARNHGAAVELDFDDGTIGTFHAIWLRDSCRCAQCRHPDTMRRLNESMQHPVDLIAETVSVVDNGTQLAITWSDDHVATAPASWLRTNVPEPGADDATVDRTRGKTLWGAELADRPPWMDYADVISDPATMLRWLGLIDRMGFALLRGMPTDRATMSELAGRIGPIRPSNYGVDWEIEASVTPKNAVYSARGLSAHSDLPYRESPPGLQFLLADVADAPGGESMLVDGYRVAEALRVEHPDFWTTLTETEVSFGYVDEEYDLRYRAPIIGLRRDGSYGVIRHAPGLLGPFDPRPARFARLYPAVHRFTEMLREPAYEIRLRLEPGELIAFDNVRVLHGRAPFDLGPGGRRHLLGCYVDSDDLHSRIRVLSRGRG